MNTSITCDKCKNTFKFSEIDLKEDEVTFEDDTQLKLTSFICPKCHHRYIVQLDNQESLAVLKNLIEVCNVLRRYAYRNRKPPEKKVLRMQKIKRELETIRNRLNKRYNKSFYLVGDVKEQLEIRVPDTSIAGEKEKPHV